jgi:branched-chain amino acid aminotransferase
MAEMEALANGYDSSILMNDQGKIAEGPGSCIFIVRDGVLITPPITASILESITRDTIIKLARGLLDTQVIERNVDRTELYICDEAFLCGSAMEVVPVLSVDGIPVGTGLPGELTQSIQRSYLSVASARVAGFSEWLTSIY